jgi:hypothetical protein
MKAHLALSTRARGAERAVLAAPFALAEEQQRGEQKTPLSSTVERGRALNQRLRRSPQGSPLLARKDDQATPAPLFPPPATRSHGRCECARSGALPLSPPLACDRAPTPAAAIEPPLHSVCGGPIPLSIPLSAPPGSPLHTPHPHTRSPRSHHPNTSLPSLPPSKNNHQQRAPPLLPAAPPPSSRAPATRSS